MFSLSPKKALNEVQEEALSICPSEDGQHESLNFKSSVNADRSVQISVHASTSLILEIGVQRMLYGSS